MKGSFEINASETHTKENMKTGKHIAKKTTSSDATNETNKFENVDYETAMELTGFGKFNVFLLLLAFPATCASTFDTASLSFVLPTATCDLGLTGYDRGLLNGSVYAGMITSSFIWGYLSDSLGRKRLLALGYLLDAFFSIASSFTQDKWLLFAFKYLSGCAIAGPFSMIMTYMSEMFGKKYRDSIVLNTGIYMSVGGIIQPVIAMLVIPQTFEWTLFGGLIKYNSWRMFLVLSAAPSLISGMLALFCMESPKFLISQGRKEEALKVFQCMYSTNKGLPPESYPVKTLQDENDAPATTSSGCFQQMFSAFKPPHLKYTILCCSVQFLGLNSLNTIRLWLPQLFTYIGTNADKDYTTCQVLSTKVEHRPTECDKVVVDGHVYVQVMYVNFITALCMALSSYMVKRTGKKIIIVSSFIISALLVVWMPWIKATLTVWFACVYVGVISAGVIGVVGLAVEMFPTSLRTLAVSLTMTTGRIGVVIGNLTLPLLLSFSCWAPFIAVFFFSCVCGLIIVLAVPGKSNEKQNLKKNNP